MKLYKINMNNINFIFEKDGSINDTLIDDIIELYKEERLKDNFCDFIIMYDDIFAKFKRYLLKEIEENIYLYIITLTEQTKNIELQHYFRETLKNINCNLSEFKISTKVFKNDYINIVCEKKIYNCYDKSYKNKIQVLKFLWFMNDYDGEIIIQNKRILCYNLCGYIN